MNTANPETYTPRALQAKLQSGLSKLPEEEFVMNQPTKSPKRSRFSCRGRTERAGAQLVLLGATAPAAPADTLTAWQERRLFHPSEVQLHNERQGRIFIYDGLSDKIAQKAVDEEFDRVQHMMFTNTIVTDETSEPVRDDETGDIAQEEDGC